MPIQGGSFGRLGVAILIALLVAGSASAQRSRVGSTSSGMGRASGGAGSTSTGQATPRSTSPPPSNSGGGYSYTPYQPSYSSYELDRQRRQFLYGYGYNPYGTLWTRSYVPRLSGDTKPSFVSLTTLAAPKPARKAYKKAEKRINRAEPDFESAMQYLREAISIYPEYAAAWTLLGRVQHRSGDPANAAQSLERAIDIDPRYLGAYGPLAALAVEEKRWNDLLRLSDAMLRINPIFTLGHYYKGGALFNTGDVSGAEKALREALSTPDARLFPESHFMLAELYRSQNSVELAAREYRLYTAESAYNASWERAARHLQQWEDSGVIEPRSGKKKQKKPAESQ